MREGNDMSVLKEQNFGFGAGLTALFDYNPGILPSFIEDVTETQINGKNTKVTNGKFFKVTTPKSNEFIVYIKYSDKMRANDNMVSGFLWEFSLTETEKNKIEFQYQNTGNLLILLVCINKSAVDIKSQVALLRWEDYCQIRHRSNIQLGIWKNSGVKKQGAKVFCLRRGKGQKKEYYLEIKRNFIEKSLDELCVSDISESGRKDYCDISGDNKPESQYVEMEAETIWEDGREINHNERTLFIKDNVTWCGRCSCKTDSYKIQYKLSEKAESKAFEGYQCPKCKQIYINLKSYENILNGEIIQENGFKIKRIKTLVDKVFLTSNHGCVYCDSQLSVSSCRLKLYKNLKETNQIDRIVDAELSYCKNCGIYYAEPVWYKKLLKEYGKNKLNFVDEEIKQMRLRL